MYEAKFEENGGIVEERIVELRRPSVQLRIRPDRNVELLSTHDQLLGGASGQSYLGCIFPADPAYSRLISEPAIRSVNGWPRRVPSVGSHLTLS